MKLNIPVYIYPWNTDTTTCNLDGQLHYVYVAFDEQLPPAILITLSYLCNSSLREKRTLLLESIAPAHSIALLQTPDFRSNVVKAAYFLTQLSCKDRHITFYIVCALGIQILGVRVPLPQ